DAHRVDHRPHTIVSLCSRNPGTDSTSSHPGALHDVRTQHVAREQEAALDELLVALEAPVLVLDREDVVVPHRVERGDEAVPLHLAEARQAGELPAEGPRG